MGLLSVKMLPEGRIRGRDSLEVSNGCVHTAYLKWINSYCMSQNSAQCYVAAWRGGEFGREWIRVCGCLSYVPITVHLKLITTLLIDYTTIQCKIKSLKKKSARLQHFRSQLKSQVSASMSLSPVGLYCDPI